MENKLPITETSKRTRLILVVEAVEILEPNEEGMQLNDGYEYKVDGTFPELADSIAKMAAEMDKDPEFGENSGKVFIGLINQYYQNAKEEGGNFDATTRV